MDYYVKAKQALEKIRDRDDFLVLAVETSCDETAVAVTRGRKVISSVVSSQIDIHRRFGGVVPEIASRNHITAIDAIVKNALNEAGVSLSGIDVIAVTYGAGLLPAPFSWAWHTPRLWRTPSASALIAVNHIKGHIAANYISEPGLQPPYICLLASGGHTSILKVNSFADITEIGSTQDDAVGEAFDKVARVLGLTYPGGPEIEKACQRRAPHLHPSEGVQGRGANTTSRSAG